MLHFKKAFSLDVTSFNKLESSFQHSYVALKFLFEINTCLDLVVSYVHIRRNVIVSSSIRYCFLTLNQDPLLSIQGLFLFIFGLFNNQYNFTTYR